MLSGRLMVCSDMSSTSASAKISWRPRCAVVDLMSTRLNPGKAGPPIYVSRNVPHRPQPFIGSRSHRFQ